MCKTRIKEWHLEKNYKAQEKQAVLDLLQRIEPSAMSNISFEIRGRPAKMDRIFRYSRDGRIVQADVDRLATSSLLLRTKRRKVQAVISVTEARLVNTLTSTSLASRSRVISVLRRYNRMYSVVENKYI
jgi:hypothetical protein